MAAQHQLFVFAPFTPDEVKTDENGAPVLSDEERALDEADEFNHPRLRRMLILKALETKSAEITTNNDGGGGDDEDGKDKDKKKSKNRAIVSFLKGNHEEPNLTETFEEVHSVGLLSFLRSAWYRWEQLGEDGRDPSAFLNGRSSTGANGKVPPLVPINMALPRLSHQKPSKNVMGQIGYYCTDLCTPIFSELLNELQWDTSVVQQAVSKASREKRPVYALPIHPGHHAGNDSFGGYCYLNQAAYAATLFQVIAESEGNPSFKVAVLDVDYHCGNGTASIFYEDPSVLVVSIHCDPDFDYPFHSGFVYQTGAGDGEGTTLHLPLPPKASFNEEYSKALDQGLDRIVEFGANAVVVSLGLDTHEGDPCAIRRAGFRLSGTDYNKMGAAMGAKLKDIPVVFIQEGGYRMDKIGEAAANVVVSFATSCH